MNYNSDPQESAIYDDDEIDLKELFSVLWRHKLLIILLTSFFALVSVIYALSLTDVYKSETLLSVSSGSNPRAGLSNLSGLASMAGINLDSGGGADKSILAIETVKSRAFLKHLITFENILPSIMAAKSYDFQSKKIQYDPEIYNENKGEWVREPQKNKQSKPSYLEAYETYLGQVSIDKDQLTNLVSISVAHISPVFAKEFLELIVNEANELLRNKDLRESSDAITFLATEVPKSSLITMKDSINTLHIAQLEKQMLSKINTEYVLKVIEPPFVPENKSSPQRSIICILGTFLGGMFAIVWVLMRYYFFSGSVKSDLDS